MKKIVMFVLLIVLSVSLIGCDDSLTTPVTDPGDNTGSIGDDPTLQQTIVLFETNGGTLIDEITFRPNQELTIPLTTKEGYSFVGWFEDSELTVPFDNDFEYGTTTLYADWEQQFNTITFMTLGGIELRNDTYFVGEDLSGIVLPTVPEIPGYEFTGWNQMIPDSMPHQDLVISAVFNDVELSHAVDGYSINRLPDNYYINDFKEVGNGNSVLTTTSGNVNMYDDQGVLLWNYFNEDIYIFNEIHVLNENRIAYEGLDRTTSDNFNWYYKIVVLTENGELEQQLDLKELGYDRLMFLKQIDDCYIAYMSSWSREKKFMVKFDSEFNVIWEYELSNTSNVFDILLTEDGTYKTFFNRVTHINPDFTDYSYTTLELNENGALVEEQTHDCNGFFNMLDQMWVEAIADGSTKSSISFYDSSTFYFTNDDGDYMVVHTIFRLLDGSYNFYGKQHFEDRSAYWIGVVYRFDQDVTYQNHELFDNKTSYVLFGFVNLNNDFVYIVESNAGTGIFAENPVEEKRFFLILKDDDNFDFSNEEGPQD